MGPGCCCRSRTPFGYRVSGCVVYGLGFGVCASREPGHRATRRPGGVAGLVSEVVRVASFLFITLQLSDIKVYEP